jgi:hypothetical protein
MEKELFLSAAREYFGGPPSALCEKAKISVPHFGNIGPGIPSFHPENDELQ